MPTLKDLADRIHREVDIIDLVGRYTEVHVRGARATAVCPFHDDHKPSMTVDPDKGLYHCFVCKAGGDSIKFVQEIENLEFKDALELIANLYGIPFEQYRGAPREQVDKQKRREETLLRICAAARDFFRQALAAPDHQGRAQAYLDHRGIAPDIIERFEIGHAPPGWDNLQRAMAQRRFGDKTLVEAGLCKRGDRGVYDTFRDRIIFPIWDTLGRPVAFGGRVMPDADADAPKYINSPETPIYTKGNVLYAYHLAKESIRQSGRAILCEGQMDVIACHTAGVTEAVASQGTALTEAQVKLLRRQAKRVVFVYDADKAGQKATLRGCEILMKHELAVFVAALPVDRDPDDIVREEGEEALRRLIDEARPALKHLTEWLLASDEAPAEPVERRLWALEQLAPCLTADPSAVRRDAALGEVAQWLEMDPELIRREVGRLRSGSVRELRREVQQRKLDRPPAAEQAFLRCMLEKPDLGEVFRQREDEALTWLTSPRVRGWIQRLLPWVEETHGGGRFAAQSVVDALAADEADAAQLREVLLLPAEEFSDPEHLFAKLMERLEREAAKREVAETARAHSETPPDQREKALKNARRLTELMERATPRPGTYTLKRR